jgi:hypothetical protein
MSVPKKLNSALGATADQARKINEVIDAVAPVLNAIGAGRLKITKSGANWIFSVSDGTGGGGVPDGYLETEVTICDRATNTAVDGTILFKPD